MIFRGRHICYIVLLSTTQIARFMGPTWGPYGSCRSQMGPMLAPWTFLSGYLPHSHSCRSFPCCAAHGGCSGGQRGCCVPHDDRCIEHPHELHRVWQNRNLMPRTSLLAKLNHRTQYISSLIARFMGPICGPSGARMTQGEGHVGLMNFAIWVTAMLDIFTSF